MKIQIYNQNFDLTEPFQQYLQARFDILDKYQADILNCQVKLIRDQRHNKGEVYTIEAILSLANKKTLIVKETQADARAAVDIIQDKLGQQIVKQKGKQANRFRKNIKYLRSLKFWHKRED